MSIRAVVTVCGVAILASFPPPSNAQWQNLGAPGGCSINALAANGRYLFAGTPFGIFVSTDDGATWAPAGEIGSAARGDASTMGIYASGADLIAHTASGLYVSRDNGANWTAAGSGLPEHAIIGCLLDTGSVLLCSISYGGLYRSTDRGTRWSAAGTGLPQEEYMSISSLAMLGQVLYAECSGDVFRSEDTGVSWAPMAPALPGEADADIIAVNGRRLIAGTRDGLFMMEEGKAAWSRLGENWSPGQSTEFLASGGQAIMAAFEDGRAYLSMDAGASWAQIVIDPAGDELQISGFVAIGSRLFVGIYEKGLFRSDDLGATWTPLETGFPSPADILCIAKMGSDLFADVAAWGAPGRLFVKTEGGAGWEPLGSVLQEDKSVICLAAAGTNLIAGTEVGLFLSDDRGRTWTPVGPRPEEPPWVNSLETVGLRLFACTRDGLLLSTDRGRTWLPVFPRPPQGTNFDCLIQVQGALLAGGSDGIFISRDGGETWTPSGRGISRSASCTSLATDGKVVVAGLYPSVREEPKATEEDAIGESDFLYRGHDIAISKDEGQSWKLVTKGLPEKYKVGRLLAASSGFIASLEDTYTKGGKHSIGLFLSTDGGTNWTSDWPGFWSAEGVNDFLVEKDEVLAATAGAGIWRLPLSALKKREP